MIPGGALVVRGGGRCVGNSGLPFFNPASVLFIGIGCTFGLLGLMSTYLETNLRWAYIPAAVMLVMGMVIFTPFVGALDLDLAAGLDRRGGLVLPHPAQAHDCDTTDTTAPAQLAAMPPAAHTSRGRGRVRSATLPGSSTPQAKWRKPHPRA